jgi:hypothetical protein
MHLAHYLGLLHKAELDLTDAFRQVGEGHADEADVFHMCRKLAKQSEAHAEKLESFAKRYGEQAPDEPDRLYSVLFMEGTRNGGLGLLRDLHDLYLMACECDMAWTLVGQAAQGARDNELFELVNTCEAETANQLKWLKTRLKQAAPQALLVAS